MGETQARSMQQIPVVFYFGFLFFLFLKKMWEILDLKYLDLKYLHKLIFKISALSTLQNEHD